MDSADLANVLETQIDLHTLAEVLDALAWICASKADYINLAWHDPYRARLWSKAASQLSKLSEDVNV